MSLVQAVPVPAACSLLSTLPVVDFCDAYQARLTANEMTVQDAYMAVFAHAPGWVDGLMQLRGKVANALGLQHVMNDELKQMANSGQPANFRVGQRLGLFTVRAISADEMIVGDDDKHLNFRISVYRASSQGVATLTVATAVQIHNTMGQLYMVAVKPFHRLIARSMLQRAVDAGRL